MVTLFSQVLVVGILLVGQASTVHVLKVSAGPAGVEENGAFRLTEERTTFSRTQDREVIVYFQWDGTAGPHKLVAQWRSPDGGFTSNSVIDYTSRERKFGAYWRLPISPAMPLGTWSIEATVDGQPAGRFTFEITGEAAPPAAPIKRPLSQQELYERLAKSFVVLASESNRPAQAAGTAIAPGRVATSVTVLDGIHRVAALNAAGEKQDLSVVIDLNRSVGWAILEGSANATPLPAAVETPRVGDRCYTMQATEAGARVLLEGQVTGTSTAGAIVAFAGGAGVHGAPVVNAFGELLGILGRTAMPDVRSVRELAGSTIEFGHMPMIPLSAIAPRPGSVPAALAAVRARGDLLEPIVGDEHVMSGGFASQIARGPIVQPQSQRDDFSSKEKEFAVFVTWNPRARLKGQTTFHVFDASNQMIATSNPKKIDIRQGDLVMSSLKIPVPKQPGVYRAELRLDGKPAWRGFVRITP